MKFFTVAQRMIKKLKKQKLHSRKRLSERKHYIWNCISDGHFDDAMIIINAERCFNYKDAKKTTVLMHVCQAKADEDEIIRFVTFLLAEGAYIQLQDVFGKTAFDYAQENGLRNVEKLLRKTVYDDFVEDLSWLF